MATQCKTFKRNVIGVPKEWKAKKAQQSYLKKNELTILQC